MIAPSGGGTAVKLKEMKFQGRSWMKMLPARKQREVSQDNLTGFLLLQYHSAVSSEVTVTAVTQSCFVRGKVP